MSEEEILDKLRKMLYHTQKANECGLSNNDFKEDIKTLERNIRPIPKRKRNITFFTKRIRPSKCKIN